MDLVGYDAKSIADSAVSGVFVKGLSKALTDGSVTSVFSWNTIKGSYEMGIPIHLYRHHVAGWANANIISKIA